MVSINIALFAGFVVAAGVCLALVVWAHDRAIFDDF
jgi:hypothetical protein